MPRLLSAEISLGHRRISVRYQIPTGELSLAAVKGKKSFNFQNEEREEDESVLSY